MKISSSDRIEKYDSAEDLDYSIAIAKFGNGQMPSKMMIYYSNNWLILYAN